MHSVRKGKSLFHVDETRDEITAHTGYSRTWRRRFWVTPGYRTVLSERTKEGQHMEEIWAYLEPCNSRLRGIKKVILFLSSFSVYFKIANCVLHEAIHSLYRGVFYFQCVLSLTTHLWMQMVYPHQECMTFLTPIFMKHSVDQQHHAQKCHQNGIIHAKRKGKVLFMPLRKLWKLLTIISRSSCLLDICLQVAPVPTLMQMRQSVSTCWFCYGQENEQSWRLHKALCRPLSKESPKHSDCGLEL